MRFHCLTYFRDEEDVVQQNLEHLLTWADAIYVLDTGSTDSTWDIVQEMHRRDKRVVPYRQDPLVYNDNLRGMVFHHHREFIEPGDWVLRTDADEFYLIPPPEFVKERMRALETGAWLQWYFFRLLKKEVADYDSGKVNILEDRKRPIQERRRYYKVSEYSEPRMFRFRWGMKWPQNVSFPYNAAYVARERLPILHYPHRDPLQMEARFRLRARMMMLQANAGSHWKLEDWRAELVDEQGVSDSSKGKKRGLAGEPGIDTGPLLYWEPGTPLPEKLLYSHVPPPKKRIIQRIIHPALLRILDAQRPAWDPSFVPEYLPEPMQLGFKRAGGQINPLIKEDVVK